MDRLIYLMLFLLAASTCAFGQTVTIVSPAGLTFPYEVAPGTEVTFQWDYFGEVPTAFFSHTEEPIFPGFGTDPLWIEYANSSDNGDGTYNVTIQVDEPLWIWGGFFAPLLQQWTFSEVFHFNVASDVVITGEDLLLCDDGMDVEILMIADTFDGYQWYMDGAAIVGADSTILQATDPGAYYVRAIDGLDTTNSNTLNISYIEMSFSGAWNSGAAEVILTATAGMDSYQWLSGPDENNLSPIAGANAEMYNATISTDLTFYSVEGMLAGCAVQTVARPIVDSLFNTPIISVSADTNSSGAVCEGTDVTYSVDEGYDTYEWFRDGYSAFNFSPMITLNQAYQEGSYTVHVSHSEWPEIIISSAEVVLEFLDVIRPQLTGVINFQQYCPGDTLEVTLADEGYAYAWYVHSDFNNYLDGELISVPGPNYSFVFDTAFYLTVVGTFNGCESKSTIYLNSYANTNMFLSVSNFDQEHLCPDSTNIILLPSFLAGDFQDFQWFKEVGGVYEPIVGADTSFLEISETGSYVLEATVVACQSIRIQSSAKVIRDYTERDLFMWATDETPCAGEEVTLNVSGGSSWESIQWFEEDVVIGSGGYEKIYIPIVGAGTDASQVVTEFQTYQVKAKHKSCPNGLKTTSNIVSIRPRINPTIEPTPNYGIDRWGVGPYDSVANYVYCDQEPLQLSISGIYDSLSWHSLVYTGDDDYAIGPAIPGATDSVVDVVASGVTWYTAVVESNGCVGYSDPILIDTWVYQTPAIASYNNSELCGPGDSTLLHIGFPGDWGMFEWFLDGVPIPNSDKDSIYAKEVGMYTVTAYPSLCPNFGFSSGIGPTVKYLISEIREDADVLYAVPQFGFYSYQWYFNGNPIPDGSVTGVLQKDGLPDGEYTVEVSNENCTVLSDVFLWMSSSTNQINQDAIKVYPNPTNSVVYLEGLVRESVKQINVYNSIGQLIKQSESIAEDNSIDFINVSHGLYMLEVVLNDGQKLIWKINKK